MILTGARRAVSAGSAVQGDVQILDGKIHVECHGPDNSIDLSGILLLPGLINAHDHLEFNLFPQLGRRIYCNAREWALDIYRPNESPVKEHISIPLATRLMWGGIRNLLCGVTTVAHHNPYEAAVFDDNFPIRVVRDFAWAHSLDFSPDLSDRFLSAPAGWPFIVHAAEGTDTHANSDIERLAALGVLARHTVLVHANAVGSEGLKLLRRHGTSIVWCPRSNLSTYGQTMSQEALKSGIRIALGTDSAITSHGDLIDEIRTAVLDCGINPSSVYRMVTSDAAAVLRLGYGQGSLCQGGVADIVAVPDAGQSPAEAILSLKPEFVMVGGRFRLLSERMAEGALSAFARGLQPIQIASRERCLIDADVLKLHGEAARAIGPDVRLSGRAVRVEAQL